MSIAKTTQDLIHASMTTWGRVGQIRALCAQRGLGSRGAPIDAYQAIDLAEYLTEDLWDIEGTEAAQAAANEILAEVEKALR